MLPTFRKLPLCLLWIAPLAVSPSVYASPAHHRAAVHLIRPGVSIGSVKLGAWTSSLSGLKSCPQGNDAALGHYVNSYRATSHDPCGSLRVYAVRDDPGSGGLKSKIEQLWTSSPAFSTSRGIRVGDDIHRVKRAYPGTKLVDGAGGAASIYDDPQDGIAFETRGTKCTAIIVHPTGKSVTDEYMRIWD